MFIDSVDFEFCYRVRQAGYLVIQSRKLSLDHSIGKGKIVSVGPFKRKLRNIQRFDAFILHEITFIILESINFYYIMSVEIIEILKIY